MKLHELKLLEQYTSENVILKAKSDFIPYSDLVISNHEKADYYTRSNFSKCLDRIEKDLVPFLNLATATMNVIASVKNN